MSLADRSGIPVGEIYGFTVPDSNSRSGKIDIALAAFKLDPVRIGEERQQMTATGFTAVAN